MSLHVLSGDSLLEPFLAAGIGGEVAVFRECLVDGPCEAGSLEDLFAKREEYLEADEGDRPGFYRSKVRPEIEKILNWESADPVCLWFEHELFCQVNLWFLLHHLEKDADLIFVGPAVTDEQDRFRGWRDHGPEELSDRFTDRQPIEMSDRELGAQLWSAFSKKDSSKLLELGDKSSKVFRYLNEVTEAASHVESRPGSVLRKFAEEEMTFEEAFRGFCENEPVYGFGDLQVKRIWDSVSEG